MSKRAASKDRGQYLNGFPIPFRRLYQRLAKKSPFLAKISVFIIGLFTISILAISFFVLVVYYGGFGKLPSYADLKSVHNATASQVYSDDGALLGKYYIQNRLNADFEDISPNVVQALVATEDARFFDHSGIDLRAWVRVFIRTIIMQDRSGGGGSTLSQQLVKNLYHRESRGLLSIPVSKVKEMFIARRLEKLYTKEELLNLYLNTVPFSDNIYGIRVAAQRFFNTSPGKLKVEEAAILVGMLKANHSYNPILFPERSFQRRNTVLHQMAKYEYISPLEKDSLQALPLNLDYHPEGNDKGLATYFREHVRQEIKTILKDYKKEDGSEYNLYRDGLKIYTSINAQLQQNAESAMYQHMKSLQSTFDEHWRGRVSYGGKSILEIAKKKSPRYQSMKKNGKSEKQITKAFNTERKMVVFSWQKGEEEMMMSPLDSLKYYLSLLNAGFMAMEPKTGKIRAWIGGIDHRFFKYDHIKAKRPVGSTFKPIVYAAAIEKGIQPCDYIDNQLVTYTEYDDWTPRNADEKYGGVHSMQGGLAHSVNTVAVDLMMRTGLDSVINLAKKMGVESEIPEVPSIALGVTDISLFEMMQVYGTFANMGIRPTPIYLLRIETADGKVLVDFEKEKESITTSESVFSETTAQLMTEMLKSVVDSGSARRLRWEYGLKQEIAGKTGTTQNQSDGWFMAYTPEIVAGAWVGGTYPQIRFRSLSLGQGSNMALPIWADFYKRSTKLKAFKTWNTTSFPPLADTVRSLLDCPFYLEERPSQLDSLFEEDGWQGLFDHLKKVFNTKDKDSISIQINTDKKTNRSRSKSSEEIRKRNEKLEKKRARKKKRKEWWDRVRGK